MVGFIVGFSLRIFFGETFLGGHRKNYELLPVSMSFLWENDVKFPFGDFFWSLTQAGDLKYELHEIYTLYTYTYMMI